jgi:hypothetical protein
MGISTLKKVLPPPESSGILGNWKDVQDKIQLELPADYKDFVGVYGSGGVDGFLWVFSPFSQNPNLNLLRQSRLRLSAHRNIKRDLPTLIPHLLHPEPGGLFPWGASDNGDVLFWITRGNPGSWGTAIYASRVDEFEEHYLPMTELLVSLVTKTIRSSIFPDDFPREVVQFIPE